MRTRRLGLQFTIVGFAAGALLACASNNSSANKNGAGGFGALQGVGGMAFPFAANGVSPGTGGGGAGSATGPGTFIGTGGAPGVGGLSPSGGAGGAGLSGGGMTGAGGVSPGGKVAGDAGTGHGGTGNCGTRSGKRGKTSRTIMVGSDQRTFIAYLPDSASPTTAVPFVYVFHGATQTGQGLYDMTEYAKIADSDGIAVVFPDGQGSSSASGSGSLSPWNVTDGPGLCGLGTLVSNPNDVDFAFVDAMKADVSQDQCIDDKHVFATGFSMGGYFSHHIACDRPDFRAAGPHSGGTMADLSSCKTTHMPIIIFHGDADALINEACDDPNGSPEAGYTASATLWAKKNGCKTTFMTIPEMGSGGMNGQCLLYDGCPADGQVEVCIMAGLSHAWSGAPVCAGCIGSGTGYPSATHIEWDFFKKYAW